MSTACLTIPPTASVNAGATPLTARDDREAVERVASIIRKYATDSVAVNAGNVVKVDLDRVPWRCEPGERARRLGVLATAWSGRKVEVHIEAPRKQPPAVEPFAVELRRRRTDSAALLLRRIERAAARLLAMVEVHEGEVQRWMLHIDRDDALSVMPLPSRVFTEGSQGLEGWLPEAALANVIGVRLEARVRPGKRTAEPGPRAPRPVRFPGRPELLPLVS